MPRSDVDLARKSEMATFKMPATNVSSIETQVLDQAARLLQEQQRVTPQGRGEGEGSKVRGREGRQGRGPMEGEGGVCGGRR